MRKRSNDERGQSMVIIVLAMVGLIAFLALVIDGGMVFAERRQMQNAADAATLAGTRKLYYHYGSHSAAAEQEIYNAVVQYALANGVADPTTDMEAWFINDSQAHTGIALPGNGGIPADALGVEVTASASFDSFFARVIGQDELGASALAASILIESPCTGPYALYAESPGCPGGNELQWSGSIAVINGSVHSNGEIHDQSATDMCGSAEYCSGSEPSNITYTCGGGQSVQLSSDLCRPRGTLVDIDDFAPGGDFADDAMGDHSATCNTEGEEAYPEDDDDQTDCYHYINGNFIANKAEDVVDGLYYVTGRVKLSGGALKDVDRTITIVALDKIDISSENMNIIAYSDVNETPPGDYVLISWAGEPGSCNTNAIKVSSSDTDWEGIMYAPYGGVDVSGSGNTTWSGAIWGYTVKVGGSLLIVGWDESMCTAGISHDIFLIR